MFLSEELETSAPPATTHVSPGVCNTTSPNPPGRCQNRRREEQSDFSVRMGLQRQRGENGPNKHHLGSFLFFWPHHVACAILVPQPRIEPGPQQWKHRVLTIGPPGNSQDHFSWAHQCTSQRNSWVATQQKPLKSPWGEDDLFSSTSFKYTGSIIQEYRQQRIKGTAEKPSWVWEESSNWGILFSPISSLSAWPFSPSALCSASSSSSLSFTLFLCVCASYCSSHRCCFLITQSRPTLLQPYGL